MSEVISVRFRSGSKNYFFDPGELKVRMGEQVIVETAAGPEFATCTQGNHEVAEVPEPLSPVLRKATEADLRTVEYHRRRESEAFDVCEKKIANHGLDMKLVSVSASFDGSKLIFYFTADGRVDFRALVRDLASVFRSRIELRQIGVRDEAKMIGGLGICGRPFCCAQFLTSFLPVSIKMAKTQNLSLNPTKISGTCGRLMCCLKYEQNAYEDAVRRMPKVESFVQTPDGPGNVKGVDLLRETVKVSLDSAPEPYKTYRAVEIRVLRNGKGSREGIEIPERTERYVEEQPEEEEVFEPLFSAPYDPEDEDAPTREKISVPASSRRRRGRKGGNRPPQSAQNAQGGGQNQNAPRPQEGEEHKKAPDGGKRRRPYHRNSRRRSGGGS